MVSRLTGAAAAFAADVRLLGFPSALALTARQLRPRPAPVFAATRPAVESMAGLEIGGPSSIFRPQGPLPVYPLLRSLDNCTFAAETVWEHGLVAGRTYAYLPDRPPGLQFLLDATDLVELADGSYDAVLASHVIEHVANPLRALAEWRRVLRAGGSLVLVVPHRQNTFDHRRPVTSLTHLQEDFERSIGEDDDTHLEEWLRLIDLGRTAGLDRHTFEERSRDFRSNRAIHHHVFDTALAVALVDAAGFEITAVGTVLPFHVVVVAANPAAHEEPDNRPFLSPAAPHLATSVFRSDRP